MNKTPAIDRFLAKNGAVPNKKYNDYVDFIKSGQKKYPIGFPQSQVAPVRGNVHLAMGRTASTKDFDKQSTMHQVLKKLCKWF